jgi:branched-chain amino acid transport system permease protein
MRGLPPNRLRPALLGVVLIAVLLVMGAVGVEAFGSRLATRTYVVFLLNVMLVLSIQTFLGNSGIVSFGHVSFMGVGAYLTALFTIPPGVKESQLPELPGFLANADHGIVVAVIASALAAALLAAVLGGGLIRMTESAMAMATLALLVVAHTLFQNWESATRGTLGLFGVPERTSIRVALGAAIVFVLIARLYKASGPGLRLRATREDPLSAAAAGTNVVRTRYVGWILSAGLMGAAGSLWAQSVIAFDPNQFYFSMTFSLLAMLVIGGRASVTGSVTGAAIVTFLADTLSRVEQGVRVGPWVLPRLSGTVQFAIALLIILTLVWRPEGIFERGEIEQLGGELLRRRRASRRAAVEALVEEVAESDAEAAARLQAATPAVVSSGGDAEALASPGQPATTAALAAEAVEQRFSGVVALAGVDLSVTSAEILGLIGPNGSGKTTLLNAVSGVIPPTAGRIVLHGRDVTGEPAHRIADRGVARTFQSIRLFAHLSVRENVEAAAPSVATPGDVDRVLGWFHLEDVQLTEAANLAYGMQRRLEIARAAVRRPSVLLLDEPAAGMNEAESDELLLGIKRIRSELDCAIVVVDHDLRLIMHLCERIQVLDQGRTIAVGPPADIAEDPEVVAAYLGTGARA